MKSYELRELSELELVDRVTELQEEVFNLRFQKATRQSSDTKRISSVRREIAQIRTIIRENELGIRSFGSDAGSQTSYSDQESGEDA